MAREITLAMIKPDAVSSCNVGEIIGRLEAEGFTLVAMKMVRLSEDQARSFYEVHRERDFYEDLVKFVTEGPVVALAIEREEAVRHLRDVIGDTDPLKAAPETIRGRIGKSVQRNAIHASDSIENARREVAFFFSECELISGR